MSSNAFMEFLRPHRTVPITPWTAQSKWDLGVSRVLILWVGLFIFGLGDAFVIQSNIILTMHVAFFLAPLTCNDQWACSWCLCKLFHKFKIII